MDSRRGNDPGEGGVIPQVARATVGGDTPTHLHQATPPSPRD